MEKEKDNKREKIPENLAHPQFLLDEKGRISSPNLAFLEMFDYEPEDIVGKNIGDFLPAFGDFNHAREIIKNTGKVLIVGKIPKSGKKSLM